MRFISLKTSTLLCAILLSGCSTVKIDDDHTPSESAFSDQPISFNDESMTDVNATAMNDDVAHEAMGSELLIPEEIAAFMSEGISISAFVRNLESGIVASKSFGQMTLAYRENAIWLVKIDSINENFPLTNDAKSALLEINNVKFDSAGKLIISDLLSMQIDIESMEVTVNIAPSLMATNHVKERNAILADSSVNTVTDLLTYNFYSNTMYNPTGSSRRDNMRFDNIMSWQEHHLNTNGFISSNNGEQSVEVNDITYEYDSRGYRTDVGMKSGWSSVQSLGDVTTLHGQKVYGGSFGNVAKSVKLDKRHTLIPLIVYMPGNGEAKIFRDGKLLDIQRMEMGNQELNTANFPVGVYDVEVEVSVGGRTVSKRTYQVNKPSGTSTSRGAELSWQVWGGAMEVDELEYSEPQDALSWGEYTYASRMAPLVGLSLGSSWRNVNWAATVYHNDKTQVSEWNAEWNISSNYSIYAQLLTAADGTLGLTARGDAAFFDGALSLWLASERKHSGSRLTTVSDTSTDSVGAALSLYESTGISGALSLSYQKDHEYKSSYWSADYSHSFDFYDLGSWIFQVGTNKQQVSSDYGDIKTDQYYASLSISLPLDGNLMLGYSKNGSTDVYNLSGSKDVDIGPVTYVGGDISMNQTENRATTSYGAYLGYDTTYLDGSVSYSGSSDNSSISLSGRGAIAFDNTGLSAGSGQGSSAIVFDVSDNVDDGVLIATVNQLDHELHSGRNLIVVPAYSDYEVNIRNNVTAEKSYQVDFSDSQYTLYPGNVVPVKVDTKEMITVFGRLKGENGDGLANVSVKNHIGITTTDSEGNFAIDVDNAFPEIIVEGVTEGTFKVDMKLVNVDGTASIGDIKLYGPPTSSYQVKPIG